MCSFGTGQLLSSSCFHPSPAWMTHYDTAGEKCAGSALGGWSEQSGASHCRGLDTLQRDQEPRSRQGSACLLSAGAFFNTQTRTQVSEVKPELSVIYQNPNLCPNSQKGVRTLSSYKITMTTINSFECSFP